MRITKLSIGTAASQARFLGPGFTPWVVVDHLQRFFNVQLGLLPSSDIATLACQGQFTIDPQDQDVGDLTKDNNAHRVTIARAAAVATVTDLYGHGLTTGDGVTIYGGGAPFDGEQPVVTFVDSLHYTYPCANSGATAAGDAKAIPARVFSITGLTGTARIAIPLNSGSAANLGIVTAVRLNVTTLTVGFVDFIVIQGLGI
jgi:hypothetical protein